MQKKLGLIDRIVYWINLIVAFLLLISFVLPYVPPRSFPTLSILSLAVSPLIIINTLFVLYWLIKLKLRILLSLSVLLIAHFHFGSFFQFSSQTSSTELSKTISILSYNVHLFNAYEENPSPEVVSKTLAEILETQQPEIICIQEYYSDHQVDFSKYPYQFIYFRGKNKLGHAIFSKYPLINKNTFDFEKSNNNAIYADVIKGNDTLRIYNLHLQSLGIKPSVSSIQEGAKDKFRKRISKAFSKQQQQVEQVIKHKETSLNPVLICGDFNNTPFSYIYKKLSTNMKDSFVENGNGLGTTYLFDSFPMRIDYILVSEKLEIIKFETIKKTFSDHYPVSATLGWR